MDYLRKKNPFTRSVTRIQFLISIIKPRRWQLCIVVPLLPGQTDFDITSGCRVRISSGRSFYFSNATAVEGLRLSETGQ